MISGTILILGLVALSQARQYVTREEKRMNTDGDDAKVMTLRIPQGQCTGELLRSMIPCKYVSLLGLEVRDVLPGAVIDIPDDLLSATVTRSSPCSDNAAFIVRYKCTGYNHHPTNGFVKRVTEPQDNHVHYTKRPGRKRHPYLVSRRPLLSGHKVYRSKAAKAVRYRKDVEYKSPTPKLSCDNTDTRKVENSNIAPAVPPITTVSIS